MTVTVKGRQFVNRFSSVHEKSKNLCMPIVEGKLRSDEDQDKFIFVDCLYASCEVKALYWLSYNITEFCWCKITRSFFSYWILTTRTRTSKSWKKNWLLMRIKKDFIKSYKVVKPFKRLVLSVIYRLLFKQEIKPSEAPVLIWSWFQGKRGRKGETGYGDWVKYKSVFVFIEIDLGFL